MGDYITVSKLIRFKNDYDTVLNNRFYTQTQIDNMLSTMRQGAYKKVNTTTYPTLASFLASTGQEGYMYLYPIDLSDTSKGYWNYIWEDSSWLCLGKTVIDLSGYATTTWCNSTFVKLDNADYTSAVSLKHSHSNKAILDATTASFTTAMSSAITANTNARHTHSNKSILDDITSAFTTEQATKLSGIAAGAQVNVLEGVQVNGTDLTRTGKKVNIVMADYVSNVNARVQWIYWEGSKMNNNTGSQHDTHYADDDVPLDFLKDYFVAQETGKGLSSNDFIDAYESLLAAVKNDGSAIATTNWVSSNYQPLSSILTNTTASFTTTLKTKLDNIEAGAQVNLINSVKVTDTSGTTSTLTPDANKAVTVDLSGCVAKVAGKGLSTNDFTTTLLNKLNNIAAGAQVNVIESISVNGTARPITSKNVDIDLTGYWSKSELVEATNAQIDAIFA